jgi:hypothetical protein
MSKSPLSYGDLMRPPTSEELIKQCSILNALRERESCAVIADRCRDAEGLTRGDKFAEGYRLACEDIARDIRAQSTDFKTMGEVMAEEAEKINTAVLGNRTKFKGDVHHG